MIPDGLPHMQELVGIDDQVDLRDAAGRDREAARNGRDGVALSLLVVALFATALTLLSIRIFNRSAVQ
jgi:hypothetical protein